MTDADKHTFYLISAEDFYRRCAEALALLRPSHFEVQVGPGETTDSIQVTVTQHYDT